MTTVLLIQTDDGNTIAVSFPSVAAARDWEDEHEMEVYARTPSPTGT